MAQPNGSLPTAIEQLKQVDGVLDMFRRLDGHVLIALDDTDYHCSRKIHCQHCSTRTRTNGGTEYYHGLLAATRVAPGHDKVIPLQPEFIVRQDGAEKQGLREPGGEALAGRAWPALSRTRSDLSRRRSVRLPGGARRRRRANWFEITLRSRPLEIENETINVLEINGYNLGHNFGHGNKTLASVPVTLNLWPSRSIPRLDRDWRAAAIARRPAYRFFEQLRTLTPMLSSRTGLTCCNLLPRRRYGPPDQRPPLSRIQPTRTPSRNAEKHPAKPEFRIADSA